MKRDSVKATRKCHEQKPVWENAAVVSAKLGFAAVVSCVLISMPVSAAPTFESTGTHVSNGLDLDWLVSTGYGSFNTTNFVQANTWEHDSETWISDTDYSVPVTKQQYQYFTFRQYFDLTGYDPLNTDLKFNWGCDDIPGAVGYIPQFSINGGAFQGGGTCTGYQIGNNLVDLTSGFVAGINYIDFQVQGNFATNGMGLAVVSFTAESANPIPEPASIALLGFGLAGLGATRRRKQEQD